MTVKNDNPRCEYQKIPSGTKPGLDKIGSDDLRNTSLQ
jgi:hypothetical protein